MNTKQGLQAKGVLKTGAYLLERGGQNPAWDPLYPQSLGVPRTFVSPETPNLSVGQLYT